MNGAASHGWANVKAWLLLVSADYAPVRRAIVRGERLQAAALKRLNEPRRNGHRTGGGFASSRNAFCLARRSPRHGIAVRYSYELDLAFPAGAIIDQNRGPVSHVQRLLFDDNLRRAHPARGKYGS